MDLLALDKNSPRAFILAASNGFGDASTNHDQVWSLLFNHFEAQPFHLYTTYGLQARAVRLFPSILIDGRKCIYPDDFSQAPSVLSYTPSFLRVHYQLRNNLSVDFDCLTPEVDSLVGIIKLSNFSEKKTILQLSLSVMLAAMEKGGYNHAKSVGSYQIITGRTGELHPVLFMSGGPSAGNTPYPALCINLQLPSGGATCITWALVSKNTFEDSLNHARELTARSWTRENQVSILEHRQRILKIRTGDVNWDTAFYLAQTLAYTHLIQNDQEAAPPFVVRTRLPDEPALGVENLHQKDDLTTLELNHLANILLPNNSNLMEALVKKFLNRIQEDGQLFSRYNASPFLKPYLECPLLAGISLQIFECTLDQGFLQDIFHLLSLSIEAWLKPTSDNLSSKPLAWENTEQCQLNMGHYPFNFWSETGGGLEIQSVESPALASMLIREVSSMRKIAGILDNTAAKDYQDLERQLHKVLEEFWQGDQQGYRYRDIQSKLTPTGKQLFNSNFQEQILINRDFPNPERLVCHLVAGDEKTRACQLTLTGRNASGDDISEAFKPGQVRWVAGRAHLTTKNLFSFLGKVGVKGLSKDDHICLETADLSQQDVTCFAPLWSSNLQRKRINALLKYHLDPQQTRLKFGIPETPVSSQNLPENLKPTVNVLWNTLIIRGVLQQGCTEHAMHLFSNLMSAIVNGLQQYEGFFPHYNSEDARPCGKANTIAGLAPVRLFLEIAGVRILSPRKVALWGVNPFPWPIDIAWQGLAIQRNKSETIITFPDGTTLAHDNPDPVIITPAEGSP